MRSRRAYLCRVRGGGRASSGGRVLDHPEPPRESQGARAQHLYAGWLLSFARRGCGMRCMVFR